MRYLIAIAALPLVTLCGLAPRELNRVDPVSARTSMPSSKTVRTDFTLPDICGRQLCVNDTVFILRSFAYSPVPICQDPSSGPTDTYSDPDLILRDGPLITAAGANAIRIYGALYADGSEWWIGTTAAYLAAAAEEGLWVIVGSEINVGLDCCDPNGPACESIIEAHRVLVRVFGDDPNIPNILMWAIGNEVNGHLPPADPNDPDGPCDPNQLSSWYACLVRIAQAIKAEQGGSSGPGKGPYVCAVLGATNCDYTAAIVELDQMDPNGYVDIWAVNTYPGSRFRTFFEEIREATERPFWIAEMGIDSFDNDRQEEDEISQANYIKALWAQIEKHCNIVLGADIAFYSDEWWKPPDDPDPCTQDTDGNAFGWGPDNFMNEEWLGVMKIREGPTDLNEVRPKRGYHAIKQIWADRGPQACDPNAPLLAPFNAADYWGKFSNNYAGEVFDVCIPGSLSNPDSNCNMQFLIAPGVSGATGDTALRATVSLATRRSDAVVLFVVTLFPETEHPFDSNLASCDRLALHARLGSAGAHSDWTVRLENSNQDDVFGPSQFPVTEDYQQFCWTLDPNDLGAVAQVVFEAVNLDPNGFDVDFVLDNLAIFSSATHDDDGDWVPDYIDNCPNRANPDQADLDDIGPSTADPNDPNGPDVPIIGDGVGDACDNCPDHYNPGQENCDSDRSGDACDCIGDLDCDSDVDLSDLAELLGHYGETSGMTYRDGDLDCDGDVDLSDLAALLAVYGTDCP